MKRSIFFLTALAALASISRAETGTGGISAGKSFAPLESCLRPPREDSEWAFTLEPYLWATGLAGDVGVKGDPPVDLDISAKSLLQNLDWGVFAKGEIRWKKWGLLADGFFAQLSASGSRPGGLYRNLDVRFQQGMASLALAYRVLDDRRGFLDVYAGARYNYMGLLVTGDVNEDTTQEIGNIIAERIAADVRTQVEAAVREELSRREAPRLAPLPDRLADVLRNAVADRLHAKAAPARARAEAAIASAKKKLARQIAKELDESLSTSVDGAVWWVDPIVGLRGQVNLTRWLFLAAQGDAGGFCAGSQIAWNVQATVGVNFTRNLFAEFGYRYLFMNYDRDGAVYDAAEFGLFSGVGVKF